MSEEAETTFLPSEAGPSARLRAGLAGLPDAERRVAQRLLAHPPEAGYDSVGRLAERAGVSPATVVRLSRRLGYAGYAALKLAIAHEAGRADQFGYGRAKPGSTSRLHEQVMAADADSIRGGARLMDAGRLRGRACGHCRRRARHVRRGWRICGAGGAGRVPFRGARHPRDQRDGHALVQHLQADTLRAGEVCVAISHTGESRDTIDVARAAALAGALTIGVTSSAGSPLTPKQSRSLLVCADQHDPTAQELFANPVAIVSALGALHAGVAERLPASPRRRQQPPGPSPHTKY